MSAGGLGVVERRAVRRCTASAGSAAYSASTPIFEPTTRSPTATPRDTVADRDDVAAAARCPGTNGSSGRTWYCAAGQQHVGEVDRDRADPHEHLARAGRRHRHVVERQHLGGLADRVTRHARIAVARQAQASASR